MNHRIGDAFAKAKAEGRGAFVAYLTMGYPTLAASEQAADQAIAGGADILELGVPFSDPFADGGVIRAAAYRAPWKLSSLPMGYWMATALVFS